MNRSKSLSAIFGNVTPPGTIQYDGRCRVMSLNNLVALCRRNAGVAHHFRVSRVTANRCHVEYSNPNEYGTEDPMTCIYPCWWEGENCFVNVSTPLDIVNDFEDETGCQSFEWIELSLPLHRFDGVWKEQPPNDTAVTDTTIEKDKA